MNHTLMMNVLRGLSHIRKTSFQTHFTSPREEMNATYVVTRNIKDFEKLSDIVPIRLPESLGPYFKDCSAFSGVCSRAIFHVPVSLIVSYSDTSASAF